METISLEVQSRSADARAKTLRAGNLIPLELYGKGVENRSFQVNYQDFRKVYKVAGSNTVIELKIDGKDKVNVLVHEIQRDPLSDLITHVDFVNVKMDEKLHTKIPLRFTGVSLAVKDLNGVLMTRITELEVKCLPSDLVHDIEVSLDSLVDFHSFVRVKDLKVAPSITIVNELEDIVATVVPPRKEEEEAPVAAVVDAAAVPAADGTTPAAVADGQKKEEGK